MDARSVPVDFIFMPHDLVRLQHSAIPEITRDAPDWVAHSLAHAPFAVVRRASQEDGAVPLGIRGSARHQRYAIRLPRAAIAAVHRPEQLLELTAPNVAARAPIPALALLADIKRLLDTSGLIWGPTGSVGFELASGIETANAASDLDLLLRMPDTLPLVQAASLIRDMDALARHRICKLDVQVETPRGAISLAEYARGGPVLLRTATGPLLTSDPWAGSEQP
jgi:phosphoribosyl-dephospho-CoA transferase